VCNSIVPNKNRQWRLKTKKAQPAAAQTVSPPKNIWVLLCKTLEKTARTGGNSEKSFSVVPLYNEARTYFMSKG
jgi:hypothetical protein